MFENLFGTFDNDVFDQFRRLEAEIGRQFGHSPWASGIRATERGAFPPLNVGCTPERVDVYLFAAGLDPQTLDLSIQQNLLSISGARAVETRIFEGDSSIRTSLSASSTSLASSSTVLRGTITPGMPLAPDGSGSSN